jgi:betaine-homocysteine S-methyltransferase
LNFILCKIFFSRENISNHFMYGTNKRIPKHMKDYGDKA